MFVLLSLDLLKCLLGLVSFLVLDPNYFLHLFDELLFFLAAASLKRLDCAL